MIQSNIDPTENRLAAFIGTKFVRGDGCQEWQTGIMRDGHMEIIQFPALPTSITEQEELIIARLGHNVIVRGLWHGEEIQAIREQFAAAMPGIISKVEQGATP